MKLRCAILDDYQGVALTSSAWSSIEERVDIVSFREHFESEDRLASQLSDFHILVIMRERTPMTRNLLMRLPKLKLLITSGMRNGSIDLAATKDLGIVVCGTGSSSEPPTELTWALILGLARNVVEEASAFRAGGPWQSTVGIDLYGKQIGIIGLGKIGSKVARIAQAFGMKVVAWSPNLTEERAEAAEVYLAKSLDALLESSDFVTIHMVLGPTTRGLIGTKEFARMRRSAYLINTSRSGLVDQAAMIDALRSGKIAGAGLDVFEKEPLPLEDELRKLPNVLGTPHLGYVSQRNYKAYFGEAIEDIQAFLDGAPIRLLG